MACSSRVLGRGFEGVQFLYIHGEKVQLNISFSDKTSSSMIDNSVMATFLINFARSHHTSNEQLQSS